MSISILCTIIVSVTLICSGMCFRCYVCNSNSNEHCEDKPRLIARCPYSAVGCVKLITKIVEYKFVNSTGGEITVEEWDGSNTNWEAIPYVKKIVTRRCGNNYARYHPKAGCSLMPLTSEDESNEIICYCKSPLCNGAAKSKTNKFLRYVLLIFMRLCVS